MRNKIDYIIVGQGLAGSCLSVELIKRGKRLLVIDQPSQNHCSTVAAGLFNPVTGKLMKKSWMAETLFPTLYEFYQEAERTLHERFFFEIPIYRPFESIEEQNDWMAKSETPALRPFIQKILNSPQWGDQVVNPLGGLLIKQCGYLNVNTFLNSVRKTLIANHQFREENFLYQELKINETEIEYKDWKAEKIIFCEGTAARQNPFFHWLPIRPMKGEVLSIRLATPPSAIYNRGVYIVPDQPGLYNVGATYQQPPFEDKISDEGKMELESKLQGLLNLPYEVVEQKWGIRPTTPDRKPMLGPHPKHKNVVVFNGLGTKGVSLAPRFSIHLADWLVSNTEFIKEVQIQRFYPLYSGSSL